jgi:hypothetical protein
VLINGPTSFPVSGRGGSSTAKYELEISPTGSNGEVNVGLKDNHDNLTSVTMGAGCGALIRFSGGSMEVNSCVPEAELNQPGTLGIVNVGRAAGAGVVMRLTVH